ncbi:AGE family epimerase/isomerase [Nocardioides mangrovi]|uniref:AGE family epimerase/isomerase n=1 Tax=Nocardioides mangrovi TaxID=2874580 RepID=A0ABS7UAX2_9ACTN|nr:AGE family epimerase/isomerase [Nocardioides mangrovi]MBZ5738144.1 AGE family epimerase/isomerase [Nocardioides mangrovi]
MSTSTHRAWLEAELFRLLEFGRDVAHPRGGAAVLGDRGEPLLEQPVHLWITARMVHVYAIGSLLGVPGCRPLAEDVARGLRTTLADDEHGGWFSAVGADGRPVGEAKSCYDHAFALLAGSTAAVAGLDGADALLERAQAVFLERFWDDAAGMCVDTIDRDWTTVDPYRGINGNMHAVEAMMAATDATGDVAWARRAGRVAGRVATVAAAHDWRIPEHYDAGWTPLPEHNRDRPADPFKPYGATVGHGLEWARLLLQVEATLGHEAPPGLADAATRLFDRAVTDGWAPDGAPGFVYTTDWSGTPVVRQRMHWVAAEAGAAAAALARRTGDPAYEAWYARSWDYIEGHLIDRDGGSWWHELDPENRPAAGTWSGKPDLYHAVQATLLPRLPLAPSIAAAVASGLLEG